MIFTNVFLGIAIFLNSIACSTFNKVSTNQISAEKSDVMVLNSNEEFFDLHKNSPRYFLDSIVYENRAKGLLSKNFEKNFEEFYDQINDRLLFLEREIEKIENNAQAFSSEYIFHRRNYIMTGIQNLRNRIECMSVRDKRKLICYEYKNGDIGNYDGILGFSIIYADKYKPFLIGSIAMPDYIGKIEPMITYRTLSTYKSKYKITNEKFYAEALNYLDRYFLETVGFK
ncbi:hypothetical protein [Candidatus Arthromitus sp. SFB-rat-Yit]|uniref:hypothetical protein n=1 Tax=Candidatus Arthromitus sp. SFB-rat-Yit TaxID=1041504 RepID=UPI00031232C5|nr:hypothetical protein [Candidatus Arthromitus sp. SFB-rat-Yit]